MDYRSLSDVLLNTLENKKEPIMVVKKNPCKKQTALEDLYLKKMFFGNLNPNVASPDINIPVSCFCCEHRVACGVRDDDPIYTGLHGDCGSEILVVGEAPSTSDLKNDINKKKLFFNCICPLGNQYKHAHFGGYTRDIQQNNKSDLFNFIDFINNSCLNKDKDIFPYFTDVVKCGVKGSGVNKKRLLALRANRCSQHILVSEIKIIKPKIIACVGKFAYGIVLKLQTSKAINKNIQVLFFTHYSRQAQLPLTAEDKKSALWPLQSKCFSKEDCCETIKKISSIKELCEGLPNEPSIDQLPECGDDENE